MGGGGGGVSGDCIIQGCESSDFNLISDFFALHKTPFSDFKCSLKALKSRSFQAFQTFSHRCSHIPDHLCYKFPRAAECDCDPIGTEGNINLCDKETGQCICKENVDGDRCDQCKVSHVAYHS